MGDANTGQDNSASSTNNARDKASTKSNSGVNVDNEKPGQDSGGHQDGAAEDRSAHEGSEPEPLINRLYPNIKTAHSENSATVNSKEPNTFSAKDAKDAVSPLAETVGALMLDAFFFQPAVVDKYAKYTVGVKTDFEEEASRRIPEAPDKIKEDYVKLRTAYMNHMTPEEAQAKGLPYGLTIDEHTIVEAWLLFPGGPQNCPDNVCLKGKELTFDLIKPILERGERKLDPAKEDDAAELKKEDEWLAKIAALWISDHDYLHNPLERQRYNQNLIEADSPDGLAPPGTHHLPTEFIGLNDEKFNLREIQEKEASVVHEGIHQRPGSPKEKACLAFYKQVLRGTLPASLLYDDAKADREAILKQYTDLYTRRNYNLAAVEKDPAKPIIGKAAQQKMTIDFPSTEQALPGVRLTYAQRLEEEFILAEIRQLGIEERLMKIGGGLPNRGGIPKDYELAYPDYLRLESYRKGCIPQREYFEYYTLLERQALKHVFKGKEVDQCINKHVKISADEEISLNGRIANNYPWQAWYWNVDPENKLNVRGFPQGALKAATVKAWQNRPYDDCDQSQSLREIPIKRGAPTFKSPDEQKAFAGALSTGLTCEHKDINLPPGENPFLFYRKLKHD